MAEDSVVIYKGSRSTVDSYSAFWDNQRLSRTDLLLELLDRNITTIICGGLAIDFCVAYSAFDGHDHGFLTYVIEDACRGITDETIEETKTKLRKKGIKLIDSSKIAGILTGS